MSFDIQFSNFVAYPAGMDYALKNPGGTLGRHLKARAVRVQSAAILQAGMRTGQLRSSIRVDHERATYGQKVTVGAYVPHAYIHHEGTRPHVITRGGGEVMRFTKGSRVIYSREVLHPGTRPNRYLSDNMWLMLT
jgi:hypothetical protein